MENLQVKMLFKWIENTLDVENFQGAFDANGKRVSLRKKPYYAID